MPIANFDNFNSFWADERKFVQKERKIKCPLCKGRGQIKMFNEETKKAKAVVCPECDGTRKLVKPLKNY